jgi:5-formyltetrahydrofolate cyclo-ligase
VAAGFCYAQQAVLFNLPAEEHDVALDWVITPAKAHRYP